MIWGAAFDADAIAWVLGSNDEAVCCEAAMSEAGELVSSVVAPSASGADVAALISSGGTARCKTAEVVSSVAAPF
jgi:hypothetical protein